MHNCIFCKICTKNVPSEIIYEDNQILVFKDISPKAAVHLLLIPKEHIESMIDLDDSYQQLIGKMMLVASKIAKQFQLKGYQLQVNNGASGGQEVFHLHLHLLSSQKQI